jgi:hypothetical protein
MNEPSHSAPERQAAATPEPNVPGGPALEREARILDWLGRSDVLV